MHDIFPATFPSGEGSDLAGVVEELGPGVTGFAPGDEVIGFTDNRASHAELVLVEAANARPTAGGAMGGRGLAVRRRGHRLGDGPRRRGQPRATQSSSPVRQAASARSPCSSPSTQAPP